MKEIILIKPTIQDNGLKAVTTDNKNYQIVKFNSHGRENGLVCRFNAVSKDVLIGGQFVYVPFPRLSFSDIQSICSAKCRIPKPRKN